MTTLARFMRDLQSIRLAQDPLQSARSVGLIAQGFWSNVSSSLSESQGTSITTLPTTAMRWFTSRPSPGTGAGSSRAS